MEEKLRDLELKRRATPLIMSPKELVSALMAAAALVLVIAWVIVAF
ncbi:hypothetical protein GOZ96_04790 [Agrobacterium vitis]|nr:hypothetical protein [Agrobacterium vitis]MUZ95906.1 hypothetical protein [Agrobacterium vitis]